LKFKLKHLDIKRNFYALILIGEGKGMLTQQDLSDLLKSDKVSIVRIIDYLSERGYVQRVKDLSDRRKYKLTLTKKADKELPLIKKEIEKIIKKALKGIPANKIEELYETLNVINSNLN
jgi:DNA-binding MarR family transcriptional regulator